MSRLILLALLGIVIYLAVRRLRNRSQRAAPRPSLRADNFVACAHCGVHVPESQALRSGELSFCSPDHRRLGERST